MMREKDIRVTEKLKERRTANMKTILTIIIVVLGISFSAPAAEIPAKPQDKPIALVGATIHTVSAGIIENGTILFENGKIKAMGTKVDHPPGTHVINVSGKHIYPGMIDANTNLGLTEIGSVRATRDFNEVGDVNPNIRAEVGVNPESELIPVTRANGVTHALTLPSGGTISGTAAIIELDGWTWEDMALKKAAGMVLNWPSMTINKAWWESRSEDDQKKDRERALLNISNAFRDARAYMQARKSEKDAAVPVHNADLRWEAMIPVLEGRVPVIVNAEDILQIQAAVAWSKKEGVKIIIMGGYDAWRAADLLKSNDIPVIITPILRTPWRRWEAYDNPMTIPGKLYEAGVKFCIGGEGGASNERNLPYHAAMASSYGLPPEEALKSVTLYPAQIFGIESRLGSLGVGKDATLIVTNGDPLEIRTTIEMEFIQGKTIPLTSRHTMLYEKYKEKYSRMK